MNFFAGIYLFLERLWESSGTQRAIAWILISVFLGMLSLIELNRQGLLPVFLDQIVPLSRLRAIEIAFNLLLFIELIELIFALPDSVSRALGKQFEVIALVLLRENFKILSHAGDPLRWEAVSHILPDMAAVSISALAIYGILAVYYRQLRKTSYIKEPNKQSTYIRLKQNIALFLLGAIVYFGVQDLLLLHKPDDAKFMESFYTMLIFADVLIVLASMRYHLPFHVTFRYVAYTVATLIMRLSLLETGWRGAMIASLAAVYATAVLFASNLFADKDAKVSVPTLGSGKAQK